jgi:FRG domain
MARGRSEPELSADAMGNRSFQTITIRSWDELTGHLRKLKGEPNANFFFRGQANPSWQLVPTLQRTFDGPYKDRAAYIHRRNEYLRAFRDHAHGLPGFPYGLAGVEDLLPLARHHGLKTPLLDWSRSPYVAAFFALRDAAGRPPVRMPLDRDPSSSALPKHASTEVAIWRLQVHFQLEEIETELMCHTEVRFPNARQKAQACIYTHLDTHEFLSVDTLLEARGLARYVQRWVVHIGDTIEAISDLSRMNIHIAGLFPDLDHAAQHANNVLNYPYIF